jgi:hypothetical protein
VRGLLSIAAWFLAFIVGANVSRPVGDWLAGQWTQLSPAYNDMLAFGGATLIVFVLAEAAIQLGTRSSASVTRYALIEDLVAGLLGVALAVLLLAGTVVVLASFYATGQLAGAAQDMAWSADLHRALSDSAIARALDASLVPGLGAVLGFVLPDDIRLVMR